jgi:ribonuclease BN (tRNA processing enzyme)
MRLIVLGSGTCVPSLRRSAPAYYLEAGKRQMLIDCGEGTMLQLARVKRSYKEIDAVFLTHTHPDHISGISPFIHALVATPLFRREKDLFLFGSRGLKKFYNQHIGSLMGKPQSFSLEVIEIEDKVDFPPLYIFTTKTIHSKDSLAYRFEVGNKSIIFTGDADFDRGLIEFSKNSDLLVADCSFPESLKAKGHMIPRECGQIAEEAGVKSLLLSHIYEVSDPDEKRVEECRKVFQGDIFLAQDFMEFKI